MDEGQIFRYLRHFGYPFNCKNRPSKKQYFYYIILSIIEFVAIISHIALFKSKITEKLRKEVGWINFSIRTAFACFQCCVMLFCLYSNMKSNHPLNKIIDDMRNNIRSRRNPKSIMRWLYIGFILMAFHFLLQKITSNESLFDTYYDNIKIFATYCHLSQFIIPLKVLSERTSQLRDFLVEVNSKEDLRLYRETWSVVLEQIRLEDIYLQLIDTYYFHLVLIVFDSLYRAIIGLYLFAGMLLEIIPEVTLVSDHLRLAVAFTHFAISVEALYKIWCVAHSTSHSNYQREKFYADLYSLCLEDKRGFLLRHDLIVIQLERRRLMHPKPQKFFPLDHSLFYHMLSNAVGCVFIIVQFQIHDSCSEM
ncbi:Gustatory receptor 190a [Halyomorpha halys]|nr:Gustatory receptor 190a [Halyomorpha halys]